MFSLIAPNEEENYHRGCPKAVTMTFEVHLKLQSNPLNLTKNKQKSDVAKNLIFATSHT
jgi:hypothetical protein